MALFRCSGNGTHRYVFGVRSAQSGMAMYPNVYIPASELAGKTKIKVTVLNKTSDISVYNNATGITPVDSSNYSAGTSVTGTVDNDMTIPSLTGYDLVRVSATILAGGTTSVTQDIILEAVIS